MTSDRAPTSPVAPLRRWWRQERPTRIVLFLFSLRWAAWGVAVIIVFLDILPEVNVAREPALLLLAFAQTAAVTLYVPLFRPALRPLVELKSGHVSDILVLSLVDVALALVIVSQSGGWDSPYYLYAVSALLVPSSMLSLRGNLILALGFVGAYVVILATAGEGVDGPWLSDELNNFVVFVAIPFLVAFVVQFFGWLNRELAEERERAQQALEESVQLQEERERLVAEQERGRLAREIHDGVAQSIYMLSLNLETAAEMAAGEPDLGRRLARLVTLAKQTLLEVRHYIFDLKPLLRGDASLAESLKSQVREFTVVSGLEVRLTVLGREPGLPAATKTAMYRIAQEALANAYRHAGASRIGIRLVFDDRLVRLEVCDDGVGFAGDGGSGRGLLNIRQRAEEIGGELIVKSVPGQGTSVTAVLPTGGA